MCEGSPFRALHSILNLVSLYYTEVCNAITKLHSDFLTRPNLKGGTDACVPGLSTAESSQADLCFPKCSSDLVSPDHVHHSQQDMQHLEREKTG